MTKLIVCLIALELFAAPAWAIFEPDQTEFRGHPIMLIGTETDKRGDFIALSCTGQVIEQNGQRWLFTARHCMEKNLLYGITDRNVSYRLYSADKTKMEYRLDLKNVLNHSFKIAKDRFVVPRIGLNDVVAAKLKDTELREIRALKIAQVRASPGENLFLEGYPYGQPRSYSPCRYEGAAFIPAQLESHSPAIGNKIRCQNSKGFAFTPGLSGAAVLNEKNEVVGITTLASFWVDKAFSYEDLTTALLPNSKVKFNFAGSVFSDVRFDSMEFELDASSKPVWIEVTKEGKSSRGNLSVLKNTVLDGNSAIENQSAVLTIMGLDAPDENSEFRKLVRQVLVGYAQSAIVSPLADIKPEQKQFIKDSDEVDSALLTISVNYQGGFVPRFWSTAPGLNSNHSLNAYYRVPKSRLRNSTICEAQWRLFDAGEAYTTLLMNSASAGRKWVSAPQNADGTFGHPEGQTEARVMTCVRNGRLASRVAFGRDPKSGDVTLYQEYNIDQANSAHDDKDFYAFTRMPEKALPIEFQRAAGFFEKVLEQKK